jgi:integrase
MTKTEAETKLRKETIPNYFAAKDNLQPPPSAAFPVSVQKKVPTVAEAAEHYLKLRHSCDPRNGCKGTWDHGTYVGFRSLFKRWIVPQIGAEKLVTEVGSSDVQACWNVADTMSRSHAKHVLSHSRAMFDVLVDDDILMKNPARKMTLKRPKGKKPDKTFLTMEMLTDLISVAARRCQEDYLIVRLASLCGLRPGEIFAIREEDIAEDKLMVDEAWVKGELHETKTEESTAALPLSLKLQLELKQYLKNFGTGKPRAFLFRKIVPVRSANGRWMRGFKLWENKPFEPDTYLDTILQQMSKEAGIDAILQANKKPNAKRGGKLTFQMLRRTTGTLFQKFGTIKDLQSLMRHSEPDTTLGVYQQEIPQELRTKMEAWDDALSVMKGGSIQ